MTNELADVSPGDIITSQRQNDITDFISDGTHEVNTLFLRIGSTIVIDSGSNISTAGSIITTGSVSAPVGSFSSRVDTGFIKTGSTINLTTGGLAFYANNGTTLIARLDDNGNFAILGNFYQL